MLRNFVMLIWQFIFLLQIVDYSLPGYEGYKTYKITYIIPDGTQGPNHPNPGMRYTGVTRVAYLPTTYEGHEVLMVSTSSELNGSFQCDYVLCSSYRRPLTLDLLSLWGDL